MNKGIKMECPGCKSILLNKNINVKNNNAYCNTCNSLHTLDSITQAQIDTSYKDIVGPVDGILEFSNSDGYSIDITWSKFSNYKFHLTFGIIISIFTLPFAIILLMKFQLMGGLIVGLFSLLGLYLLYQGAKEYFNRTILHFQGDHLYVNHEPLSLGAQEVVILKKEIDQVYIKKVTVGSSGETEHFKHDIYLSLKDRSEHKILSLFKTEQNAYYVERLIEKHLNIVDKITASEHRPGQDPNQDHLIKVAKILQKVQDDRNEN